MQKLIAICEFHNSEKQYEYLCELPDGAILENYKYAVSLQQAHAEDANILKTKRLLGRLQVLFIREFKPISDQHYSGELQRLVFVFGMDDFVQHAIRRQQIATLKANLERRLADLSIFDKIKSLGITDSEITSMAEELKKLLGNN